MPAGLVVPCSGPYLGVYSALALGTLSDDGYVMTATVQGQEVNETDAYGLTLVEAIYRGINWRLRLRGLEWKSGLLAILQQFGMTSAQAGSGLFGVLAPQLGVIGDRWTKYNSALVLSSILGNPPAVPQSLTALSAGIAPNNAPEWMMTSKVREIPLELVLYPYSAVVGSVTFNLPFTTT